MLASIRKSFALLVALTAMFFAGNAQAIINSTATDGTFSNKVVHTFVSGGSCTYVSYNHYELYYRKLPTDTTWTLYFSRYVPGGYYYLWAEDTGGMPGKTYDYYMEVASPSLYLWCNGYTDRGWANNPPTALSAALPGSTIGSARVCVAPSVTDPNLNQPNTTSPDTFTYSIVSQPATGTASIVSNQVCYTPPAIGPTQSYNFTIKVTDKAGNTINGTASGTVTNPTPPPSQITGLTATNGTVTNAIVLSWPASSSTNSYDVYRSTILGTKGSYIGNTASTTYSDPISNASLYYYKVTPRNINGPGPDSNQDVGWANIAPTATSVNILAVIGGPQQCVTPSVTDANNPQGENYTFSILSQPTQGTAAIVSNKVCYTPVASGAGGNYAFTYRVTDKGGAMFNGSANVSVSGAVQNVYATQGAVYGKSIVSWTVDPLATNYDIYRSTTAGVKGSLIGSATGTGFNDTAISGTTHYFYTVVANTSAGSTPNSTQAEGWGKIPSTITDLTATKGILQNKVALSWSKNPDATGYEIWRSTTSGGSTTKIATLGAMALGYYEDTTVSGMTRYYYRVKAVVGSAIAQPSNEAMGYAIIATSKVTGVTATQGTLYGKSTVSWTADSAAANYDIFRSATSGTKGSILGSNVTGTGFDDATVSGTTHYFYTVIAKNSVSSAPDSAQAEGWGKVPVAIRDLTATQGTLQNKVGLSWSKNPDATGYEVWRSTTSGGSSTKIATLGAMAMGYYEDATVSGMTQYFYKFKVVVGSTISQPSNEAMGYAIIATSKVTGVTATQGTLYGKSTVNWTADPAASNYDIYRSTSAGARGSIVGSNVIGTNFDNTTVFGTIHYFYTVIAKNFVGSSPDSDQAEGWGKMPGVVTNLIASQGTLTNKVRLNWSEVVDATGYEVWRTSTSEGTSTKIATLTVPVSTVDDATVSGVASYFYIVKTLIGSLSSDPSIEVEGWANGAPTNASAKITTTSTEKSLATPPTILDPNVTAGKNESISLSITTPPATGTLSIVDNKFVYTPPADARFSGTLTFKFSVTDKGGELIMGNGTINVVCQAPFINALNLSQNNILQASAFDAYATYSLPACSTNGKIGIEVLDSGNNIVSSSPVIPTPNGQNLTYKFANSGIVNIGTYTVRMTASSDFDSDAKAVTLTVDAVNLPTLKVTPGLSVTIGEETISATLSNPPNINCPFTNDSSAAIADPGKCYVSMINPPLGMTINNADPFPSMSGTVEDIGSFPITAEVQKFDGTKLDSVVIRWQPTERYSGFVPPPGTKRCSWHNGSQCLASA
jgi:fibronectin type 3 domain-containing protein